MLSLHPSLSTLGPCHLLCYWFSGPSSLSHHPHPQAHLYMKKETIRILRRERLPTKASEGERVIVLESWEGTRASRRVEEGLSRSFSACGGKPSFPSTSPGDLRELPRVPLRREGLGPRDALKKDSRGLSRGAAGAPDLAGSFGSFWAGLLCPLLWEARPDLPATPQASWRGPSGGGQGPSRSNG